MNKTIGAAAVILLVHCAQAGAADSVTIELASGYPPPSMSAEKVTLEILRIPAAIGPKERPIDQYFDAVRAVLKPCGVAEDWQFVSPDSAFVRMKIAMDGRSITGTEQGQVWKVGRFMPNHSLARYSPASP